MKLNEIVPGATYSNGNITRRVIELTGVIRVHADDKSFYDDANIIKVRSGIMNGIYSGNPSSGAYRDLTAALVGYLEADLSSKKECSIVEFADWADFRVE